MSEAKLASAIARLAVIRAEKAAAASAAKPNGNEDIPAKSQELLECAEKLRLAQRLGLKNSVSALRGRYLGLLAGLDGDVKFIVTESQ